jgi:hypothetical protein
VDPVLLIADNLTGQDARFSAGEIGKQAKAAAARIRTVWWNTVSGCTDAVQPVDAGLGRELKRHIGICQTEWLEDTSTNLLAWEGGDESQGIKPLSASERVIIVNMS